MHGWRARIGVLVVSDDVTTEREYALMRPEGVSVHAARMRIDDHLPAMERLERMNTHAETAAADLATARPDVITYACTSGSFFRGADWTRNLVARLGAVGNCRVVATAQASVDALRALGATRIGLATPYEDEINRLLVAYMEASGFEVGAVAAAGLHSNWDVVAMDEDRIAALALAAAAADTEAVYFACTAVPIVGQIAELEHRVGRPVVTANQATMWAALREIGIRDEVKGYGRLLAQC